MAATSYPYVRSAVNVSSLDATPVDLTIGFNLAIIADITGGSAAGDLFRAYGIQTAVTQAATDLAAGNISTIVNTQINAIAAQDLKPQTIYVVKLGAGTYAAALAAFEANGYRSPEQYVGLLIDSRADADIVDASDAAQSRSALRFVAQTDDAGSITSGVPSGFSSIVTNSRTALVYEDTDAAAVDAAWLGRIFGTNLRVTRQSGIVRLSGLAEYTAPLTAAQQALAAANFINYHTVTTWQSSQRNMAVAKMLDGTTVSLSLALLLSEVLTYEALAELIATKAATGEEVLDDDAGQQEVEARIRSVALVLAGTPTPRWIGPSADLPNSYKVVSYTVSSGTATLTVDYNFIAGVRSITVVNYLR
jgi:hypothetical protein